MSASPARQPAAFSSKAALEDADWKMRGLVHVCSCKIFDAADGTKPDSRPELMRFRKQCPESDAASAKSSASIAVERRETGRVRSNLCHDWFLDGNDGRLHGKITPNRTRIFTMMMISGSYRPMSNLLRQVRYWFGPGNCPAE